MKKYVVKPKHNNNKVWNPRHSEWDNAESTNDDHMTSDRDRAGHRSEGASRVNPDTNREDGKCHPVRVAEVEIKEK